MGYCYSLTGKRVCDICGKTAPSGKKVIKVRCPYGWCQPYALCPVCRKEKNWKDEQYHPGCRENSLWHKEKEQKKTDLLQKGHYIRTAAMGVGKNTVKVWFKNQVGHERLFLMSKKNYDSIPLLANATLKDYRKSELVKEVI